MQVNRADWQELLQQGRLVELEQVLLREAQQPEITTQALLQVAGLLRDSNRFGSAIAVMKKVLERQPGDAIQHFRLARLYQGTGQHEPALQAYRRALQLNPGLGGGRKRTQRGLAKPAGSAGGRGRSRIGHVPGLCQG
jgi:tetratricopeptide (TPR) repeat protein